MSITQKCPILPFSSFSSFLSTRRRILNLSVADLARRAALPVDVIERLEKHQFLPSPSQAYRLGAALQVDPVELGEWTMILLLQHPEFLLEPEGTA